MGLRFPPSPDIGNGLSLSRAPECVPSMSTFVDDSCLSLPLHRAFPAMVRYGRRFRSDDADLVWKSDGRVKAFPPLPSPRPHLFLHDLVRHLFERPEGPKK